MAGPDFAGAFVAGVERVTAWSDLLDRINVFPIADGDTGRNLVLSLAPLRRVAAGPETVARELLFAARGNSGNIAARFFHALIRADRPESLPDLIKEGRDQAWQAVGDPQPGTMLTFFDGLSDAVRRNPPKLDRAWVGGVLELLAEVVRETTALQPRLARAGVVDAGALGMFLFFDGFLNALIGNTARFRPIVSLFGDRLRLNDPTAQDRESGYCVDMVLSRREGVDEDIAALSRIGESTVVIRDGDCVKVHLHTPDRERTRKDVENLHHVLSWSEDDLEAQTAAFSGPEAGQALHVMTDAAGSLTRAEAQALGVTLLDSYIILGGRSLPESCLTPELLYEAMREGTPVSTSQASVSERHQFYESVLALYGKVLYLCVGSVYTGNWDTARRWKTEHDPDDGLLLMDTGCAAGRLGLLAALTARFARQGHMPDEVPAFAGEAVDRCREYIFLDRLHYLAAGGRLSKTGAFFGDMMRVKPVISPRADGAGKVGVVRNRRDQVAFAAKRLAEAIRPDSRSVIWLSYTDNREWVAEELREKLEKMYPEAEIAVKPLSLTTGAHTGPGTWSIAFFADK